MTDLWGRLWLAAHLCLCVLIVKIRVIIRNDWWPRVVIFIFFKLHLGVCFRKPEQTVVIVFFPVPLQSERHQEDILNHAFLSKCEPYYFYIFWECHCSEKFQIKGWYKTLFLNISNGEFSCSDYFSFVEGHIKLYVHIKQSYVSSGEYIGITGPLIIFPWSLLMKPLLYFYCWHSNGIEPRVFSSEEKG